MSWSNQYCPAPATIYPNAKKRVPDPNTGNVAIYPAFSLPGFSVQGPGYVYGNGNGPYVVNPYPQRVYAQAQQISGLPGVVYGGAYQQKLINLGDYLRT